MKLYSILFESVGESDILDLIKQIIKSKSYTGQHLKDALFKMRDKTFGTTIKELFDALVKDFYEKNKDQFHRMLKDAKYIKYLGGGAYGDAFDIGDMVLKIEVDMGSFSSRERAEKAATALYPEPKNKPATKQPEPYKPGDSPFKSPVKSTVREATDRSLGKYVPMIYDKGEIYYYGKISWILMEKFEPVQGEQDKLVTKILDAIVDAFMVDEDKGILTPEKSLEKNKDIKNYSIGIKRLHKRLGSELRLKNGWFIDLVQGMWELKRHDITDFHSGNIGIRRTGGEGSLVFFD